MSRSRIELGLTMMAVCTVLAGCSDIYLDRRESIELSAGDAMRTNQVTLMVDPWPPYSGDRDIAFNGEKMQSAVERYRTNRIIQPAKTTTSSADYKADDKAAPVPK